MAKKRSIQRWLCALAVTVASGVGAQTPHEAPAQPIASADVAPLLKPGDAWTYRTLDRWKDEEIKRETYTVFAVRAFGYVVELTEGGSASAKRRRWSQDLNGLRTPDDVEKDVGWWKFPLTVGNHWESVGPWGRAGRTEIARKVAGTERITTPAGTFDTYRIEGSGRWFPSEQNTGSGVISETIWYAPSVKRHVRRDREVREASFSMGSFNRLTSQTREELVEYKLQP